MLKILVGSSQYGGHNLLPLIGIELKMSLFNDLGSIPLIVMKFEFCYIRWVCHDERVAVTWTLCQLVVIVLTRHWVTPSQRCCACQLIRHHQNLIPPGEVRSWLPTARKIRRCHSQTRKEPLLKPSCIRCNPTPNKCLICNPVDHSKYMSLGSIALTEPTRGFTLTLCSLSKMVLVKIQILWLIQKHCQDIDPGR